MSWFTHYMDIITSRETVLMALYVQCGLMVAVFFGVTFLLWYRNSKKDYSFVTAEHFNQQIACFISDEIDSIYFPENITSTERKILRNCLLDNIQFITGYEREMLVKKYEDFGFLAADLEKLKSPVPEVRLKSVLRLDILNQYFLANYFHNLVTDSNVYVSTASLVALSKLDHPLNKVELLNKLPKQILKRQTILIEILTHYKNTLGFEPLSEILTSDKFAGIKAVCLKIFAMARDEKSVSLIFDFLDSTENLSVTTICDLLPALGKMADERMMSLNRGFIRHASPKVRAIALKNSHLMYDPEFEHVKEHLKSDTSFEVRKVMSEITNSQKLAS